MKRRETIFINNPLSRYFLQSYQEKRSRSPCGGRPPSHSLERAGEMKFVREPQLFRHFLDADRRMIVKHLFRHTDPVFQKCLGGRNSQKFCTPVSQQAHTDMKSGGNLPVRQVPCQVVFKYGNQFGKHFIIIAPAEKQRFEKIFRDCGGKFPEQCRKQGIDGIINRFRSTLDMSLNPGNERIDFIRRKPELPVLRRNPLLKDSEPGNARADGATEN